MVPVENKQNAGAYSHVVHAAAQHVFECEVFATLALNRESGVAQAVVSIRLCSEDVVDLPVCQRYVRKCERVEVSERRQLLLGFGLYDGVDVPF